MNHIYKHRPQFNSVKLFNEWIILFIITVVLFLASCTAKPDQMAAAAPPPVLPVTTVSTGEQETFVDYPAAIQGTTDVEIRPQISGTIDRILVNEGQLVSKGQLLLQISELPFKAQLNNAKAALQAAQSAVLNAQLEVDKLTPLVQSKVVSDFQLKTAKTTYQIALANVEQAKANVNSAQINLGYTQIKAPSSGYIGRLPKKQGSLVSPSDPEALTQLSDVNQVYAYFSLAETDFINFNAKYEGNSVADRIKHLPAVSLVLADQSVYPVKGKIDMINGQFDKTTGSITLRAVFANSKGLLRSGNTGKIRLGLSHDNTMLIPQSATVEMQDKIFVFAVGKDNKVNKVAIAIDGKSGTNYLIKDGLKSGDQIVLSGLDKLQDGQLIQPDKKGEKIAQLISKN
ncbi:efflux RND transporter periplasmic adaptor subunit [Pedobacter chitinilyticus]|uniref:Efflux RND transporter periplasmic adaptor subunit n=1 Tax=Pedobacter chitinilyticus TaxID=2233776 RepID=A0A3S3R551_9SPHI|nr:efflux RND transporter periplasmic adaptor subunit [Pedobacter chitinilyticus]RWU05599.1 efflux RND transporter periplasmic adaptor subunit [Pedobacter chitinilyticus]